MDEKTIEYNMTIRNRILDVLVLIDTCCPDTKGKNTAMVKLTEVVKWCNASFARKK